MAALFELDDIPKLPLWAQVLIASRMARRAILHLPKSVSLTDRKALLDLCDATDEAAEVGEYLETKTRPLADRMNALRSGPIGEVAEACYWAWDAAGAAHGAQSFPVDATCIRDAQNAISAASRSNGLSALQVRIFAAADLDLLRFACAEFKIGFYDALGAGVMGRLTPVYPPDE